MSLVMKNHLPKVADDYSFPLLSTGVGGGSFTFSTMCCNVDGALNSLSTSKDGSQVVVAGRNGESCSVAIYLAS